jgi:hypothetical protein
MPPRCAAVLVEQHVSDATAELIPVGGRVEKDRIGPGHHIARKAARLITGIWMSVAFAFPRGTLQLRFQKTLNLLKSLEKKSERVLRFRNFTWPPLPHEATVSPALADPSKAQ